MEYNKILFPRLVSSFLWTAALQIFPLFLYVLVTNIDIVHPLDWILQPVSVAFSIGTWISLLPVHVLIFLIGYTLSEEHKRRKQLIRSRFTFFCCLFTKSNFTKLALYLLLGVNVPWMYLKFNDRSLLVECQDSTDEFCLNETSVFLITCGVWTAVSYVLRFDILVEKHLEYPIIKQLRFLQIRYKFFNSFCNCLTSSVVPLFYFIPFYMWYGRQVVSLYEALLAASVESSTISGFGVLKVSLLVNAWLISTAVYSIVTTLEVMIQIHFTEHYSFALIKQSNSDGALLSCALGEKNVPIIQHLACHNLYVLSVSQKSIRWQIFTLSQPGGHPHTWNAILHESLKQVDEFICTIESIYKVPPPAKPKSPIPRHIHARDMTVRHEEIITGPVPLTPVCKLRNLMEQPPKQVVKEKQQSAMDEVWSRLDSALEMIQKNSVVSYVFDPRPDAEIRFLLSNSQPLVWIVQSIAELSANAIFEDQFGIVLKDLPLIINTLLRLKCSLDKLGNLQNKFHKRDHDLCMKASLKSALRRSLYRIAIAYSGYLTDLPLSSENLACMQNFVNFKES